MAKRNRKWLKDPAREGKKEDPNSVSDLSSLRQRTEEFLHLNPDRTPVVSGTDVHALVHELQVHQAELLAQNQELLQTQIELAESRDRYAELYDFAPVGYLTLNEHGRIVEANLTAAGMLGVERASLLGKRKFSDFIARDSQDDWYLCFRRLLACAEKTACELAFRRDDGKEIFALVESVVLQPSGTPLRCMTTLTDATRRRAAEEKIRALNRELEQRVEERTAALRQTLAALTESEERHRRLLATVPDALMAFDAETLRFIVVNNAAESLYGYTREEFLGRRFFDLAARREDCERLVRETLSEGRCLGRLSFHRKKDGAEFPVETTSGAVTVRGRAAVFVVARDMSERRRLEKEVLEISGQERGWIGQELHDGFGQELVGLRNIAKSLQKSLRAKSAPEEEKASILAEGMHRLLDLARKISKGLFPVEFEASGLMAALQDLALTTQERCDVSCRFECPRPVPIQDKDAALHLYRIVQEAITNAVRHARAKEIVARLEASEDRVVLTVRDDGVGIAVNRDKHYGLGLRIMQHRASLIGATLTVQTPEEGGTLVACTLLRKGA